MKDTLNSLNYNKYNYNYNYNQNIVHKLLLDTRSGFQRLTLRKNGI
jgi:hypothetical protein